MTMKPDETLTQPVDRPERIIADFYRQSAMERRVVKLWSTPVAAKRVSGHRAERPPQTPAEVTEIGTRLDWSSSG